MKANTIPPAVSPAGSRNLLRAVSRGDACGAVTGAASTAGRGEEEAGGTGGDCGGGPAERAVGEHDGPLG